MTDALVAALGEARVAALRAELHERVAGLPALVQAGAPDLALRVHRDRGAAAMLGLAPLAAALAALEAAVVAGDALEGLLAAVISHAGRAGDSPPP